MLALNQEIVGVQRLFTGYIKSVDQNFNYLHLPGVQVGFQIIKLSITEQKIKKLKRYLVMYLVFTIQKKKELHMLDLFIYYKMVNM